MVKLLIKTMLFCLALLLLLLYLSDFFNVDACLDGGGKWNEQEKTCEYK